MASDTWLDRADWRHRSSEFGSLRECELNGESIVVMELDPRDADPKLWAQTQRVWRSLPEIPHVVEAVAREDGPLLLRYAAIDWRHRPIKVKRNTEATARLAAWGVELTRTFDMLLACVPECDLGWLCRPLIKLDLAGRTRIVFLPISGDSPPRSDERALVHLVGGLLSQLVRDRRIVVEPLALIIARCLAPDPGGFAELRGAWAAAGGTADGRPAISESAWRHTEAGIGLLALNKPDAAVACFDAACRIDSNAFGAARARAAAYAMGAKPDDPYSRLQPIAARARLDRAAAAREQLLQPNAAARSARPRWEARRRDDAWALALDIALREPVRIVERALARTEPAAIELRVGDPDGEDALANRTRTLLVDKRYADALASADQWIVRSSGHGLAHYFRGRCLFALGRLVEARDSFDIACARQPQLLAALLLRREVDRCLERVRRAVGTQAPMVLDVPAHLAALRAVVVDGRVDAAIDLLSRPEYAADPVAGLLLAGCLMFERRADDALPVYQRVADASEEHRHAALVGTAQALLALERGADALVIFDVACGAQPEDANASEGRAQALKLLGRDQEAEAELRRFISLDARGSELRVRSARRGLPKP